MGKAERIMDWRSKLEIGIAVILAAVLFLLFVQHRHIQTLTGERDKYRHNTETLLGDVEQYRIRDSLSAARVQSLELTVKEFERFRAEDAALIRQLKDKNRDLAAVNKTQAQTIIDLYAVPKDTILIRDTIPTPAIAVHAGDAWFDFDGVLTKDAFRGTLRNRDSLLVAETVKYKRFLGFLWKTRRVKDRRVDVVSQNPHTTIMGVEYIVIEK